MRSSIGNGLDQRIVLGVGLALGVQELRIDQVEERIQIGGLGELLDERQVISRASSRRPFRSSSGTNSSALRPIIFRSPL